MPRKIRVTLPANYSDKEEIHDREGHYFEGETIEAAIDRAFAVFPGSVLDVEYHPSGRFLDRYVQRHLGTPDECWVALPPAPPKPEPSEWSALPPALEAGRRVK